MSNSFSKEERVAFEDLLEGFQDALVLSRHVNIYNTDQTMMERANNTIWRPQPYIAQSQSSTPGTPVTYQSMTQLAVPATLGFSQTVPWEMTTLELRDALQEGRLGESAKQKLASDINVAIMNSAASLGSLVVPIAAAAGDYDDIALCDTIMNEQGVPNYDRFMGLSSRDYNGLAGNLSQASRSFGNAKSDGRRLRHLQVRLRKPSDTCCWWLWCSHRHQWFEHASELRSSGHLHIRGRPDQRGQPLPDRHR